jgi:hypothetical protein
LAGYAAADLCIVHIGDLADALSPEFNTLPASIERRNFSAEAIGAPT